MALSDHEKRGGYIMKKTDGAVAWYVGVLFTYGKARVIEVDLRFQSCYRRQW